MITAVDTNVLSDFFGADPAFGPLSRNALATCQGEGVLTACEVVWAELLAFFPTPEEAHDGMAELGIQFSPMTRDAAVTAGNAWKTYRVSGGRRDRLVADFLIGAHALLQADRLLTRDRGFYRTYFSRLPIVDPSRL